MNAIDLIVALLVVLALWRGWQQGFVVQVCSLAGIAAGIWLAARYGAVVGEWLHFDPQIAVVGGFVVVLLSVVLIVAIVSRLLRGLCRIVGFGIPDRLLGVVVSTAKTLLVVALLMSAFDRFNQDYTWVEAKTIEGSICFRPLVRFTDSALPVLKRAGAEFKPQKER